jgi:hypothetical protein
MYKFQLGGLSEITIFPINVLHFDKSQRLFSTLIIMASVGEWLEKFGLGEYKESFEKEGFDDILVIPHITEHDLAIIGNN